jgi:MIP family channel proteins
MANPKVFVAEFIGTFALVFVSAAAGLYNVGLLGIALACGLTLAAFWYVFGYISGTHVNPAVTLGLAANGNIKWRDAAVYWVAQFSGAALAAFSLKTFVSLVDASAVAGIATKGVLTADHAYYAMGIEALLTFFLVNAYLHTTGDGKAGPFAGWAIGITLTISVLAGAPLTGASLNPARSFGPALFSSAIDASKHDFQNPMLYLIYFVGPFIGAIAATLLYQFFKHEPLMIDEMEDELEEEMETVEIIEEVVEAEPVKKPARKSAAPKARKSTKK